MMNTIHNLLNPVGIVINEQRLRFHSISIREKIVDMLDAVGKRAVAKAAVTTDIRESSLHIGVADGVLRTGVFVKNVVLHGFFLLIIVIVSFIFLAKSNANHSVNNFLLLFGQRVKNIADGFFIVGLIVRLICVGKLNVFSGSNDAFLLFIVAMRDNSVDISAWICSCKHQTNFTNRAVKNIGSILFELVRINRKRAYVSMLNKRSCCFSGFRIVQITIGVYTLVSVFQHSMPENIERIIVLVVPDQRNIKSIILLERIAHNNATVRAL